jgi:hypothetical protein
VSSLIKQNNIIEFNFHEIVGLKLINPTDFDVNVITKKFDITPQKLTFEPDIVITYNKELAFPDLTYIGLNAAAFSNNDFYILSNGKENVKVIVPFEDIGLKQLKIVCESGSPDIPLLNHFINLTFLSKGYLPLHSTAFQYDDIGALVLGWTKGGKSESLFSFMNNGAEYVSDEISIISNNGKEVLGLKVPICIWKYQFKEIPDFIPKLNFQKQVIMKVIQLIKTLNKIINFKLIDKAVPLLDTQLHVKTLPSKIFSSDRIIPKMKLDVVFFAVSHSSNEIVVEPISINEVIDRMISSQEEELDYFYNFYRMFKYAFPQRINEFLENLMNIQYRLMKKLLENKKAYIVKHPYPVSFKNLYTKMKTIYNIPR